MEETKRILTEEEMYANMFSSDFIKVSRKDGYPLWRKVYLWECAKCQAAIWVLNVPRTGGAEGGW